MRALTWHGKHDVRVETVDDPKIINPRDIILKIGQAGMQAAIESRQKKGLSGC